MILAAQEVLWKAILICDSGFTGNAVCSKFFYRKALKILSHMHSMPIKMVFENSVKARASKRFQFGAGPTKEAHETATLWFGEHRVEVDLIDDNDVRVPILFGRKLLKRLGALSDFDFVAFPAENSKFIVCPVNVYEISDFKISEEFLDGLIKLRGRVK